MSSTLLIRHLCGELEVSEREDFLKYFGAEKVWFINPSSHTAFASFSSKSAAESALGRLHQLEVLGKRLTVEYANESKLPQSNQQHSSNENSNTNINNFKEFIAKLNSCNPYLNLYQPPPPNISYKYPPASSHTLFNILYALAKNVSFYIQTLHLMNKIGLDPPFDIISDEVKTFVKECLIDLKIVHNHMNAGDALSSEESEISYEDEKISLDIQPKQVKRKINPIKLNKRLKVHCNPINNDQQRKKIISTEEVFETSAVTKVKKIEINVSPSIEPVAPDDSLSEVVGEIGKMDIPLNENKIINSDNNEQSDVDYTISTKELLSNKISLKDMKSLPVYKNYHPGTPSMRLYIKNLAKQVTSKDMEVLYKRYASDNEEENKMFDVRVMQEGRMKGQAFVTLPNTELSQKALDETNGFIFKNKPMVVQFARTANK